MTYSTPLQVVETEENRTLIKEMAQEQGVSQAAVTRELIRIGLAVKKGAQGAATAAAEKVTEGTAQLLCLRPLSTSGAACSLPAGHNERCRP